VPEQGEGVPCPAALCYFSAPFRPPTNLSKLDKPMALERSDVDKIAHLARLAIPEEAKDRLGTDLSNILALMEQMGTLDTAGVEPMAHPLHMIQRLRPDTATEPNQRAHFQAIAPQTQDGLYLVPKVIE
jgi:aspartyl-tRNA(Asn)/glutamyl-tRNA(Gln) amidotransferase subunit C